MGVVRARLVTYGVVGALAWLALGVERKPTLRRPAEVLAPRTADASTPLRPSTHHDTLGRGETLVQLLRRRGVRSQEAVRAFHEAAEMDARRVPAGLRVAIGRAAPDSEPNEIVFQLAADRVVRVTRQGDEWRGTEERLPWTTDTVVVRGTITSTLYASMDEGETAKLLPVPARRELAWNLADILEYRLDMSRDLHEGDSYTALVERSRLATGAVRVGKVLATTFTSRGEEFQAFRFRNSLGRDDYYDASGKSLRAAFLRAPLEFRRISSVFGRRKHPVLGIWRAHKGTDYAASSGTPVRTIGNGVVIHASWKSGFGNTVEVRHPNGYVTRYGHLKGFARGIRRGTAVSIGTTIGYVGMTGLASGPHLHFEVLVGGVQRDPRVALANKSGEPVRSGDRGAFERMRAMLLAELQRPDSVRLALAP